MPTFCRHNRFVQNCPICSREQATELHEAVTPGGARTATGPAGRQRRSRAGAGAGVTVSRLSRGVDDGFHSRLVPGLKSSADAERLALELALAAARLELLRHDPPGLYAEVAADGEIEERTWLAFLIAYLGPLQSEDPFASIRAHATRWSSGELPELDHVAVGPRGAHDSPHGARTLAAYREWARRAGTQAAAFTGEAAWPAERRFARVYERLGLPGLHRDARYDLLVTLGALGVYELRPATLQLGGENEVTLAAKRALGIGDPLVLERRAAELAEACGVPLEALDLGFYNWGRGEHVTQGVTSEPDASALAAARVALRL